MNATVEQLAPVEQHAADGWVVAALYQFKEVQDSADLQQRLLDLVKTINLCGTLIVADEGINGTVAGDRQSVDVIHQFLLNEGFASMEYKESHSSEKPFRKMKIKHKKEIVVDDSVLFEPTLQVTKSAPTQPAEPVGRMHGQYKLKAIVEDRVWLEDPQGNSITVTQGDPVSGLGNLTAVDEHDFKVRFSTGTTLKGQ